MEMIKRKKDYSGHPNQLTSNRLGGRYLWVSAHTSAPELNLLYLQDVTKPIRIKGERTLKGAIKALGWTAPTAYVLTITLKVIMPCVSLQDRVYAGTATTYRSVANTLAVLKERHNLEGTTFKLSLVKRFM